MLAAQRRHEILRAVRTGTAHVGELAAAFGVSEMTVRRDLADLERGGKLTRVHGGAVVADEPSFAEVAVERLEQKDRIGAAAAALVQDGQTIMLDIGTTTLQLARHLRGRRVTVITTNLAAYEELLPEASIELVLLGGVVRRNYRSLVGVLAEDALRQLRADVAFLGASGIEEDLAVVDTTMVEVPIKRAMLAAAARSVLLADSAKFGMRGVVRVCGPEDLDVLVTDGDAPAAARTSLARADVEVVTT
ncbi:MAG: DeoR/GlpR family DNA-binding transcription regulator [Solirubrobacteraceae bacterium]